jgi:hypothetical protein
MQWEEVDLNADYPSSERYRAVSDKYEYRIFHDPEERHGAGLKWILVVRMFPEGRVPTHVHYGAYRTVEWAKRNAELSEGPATQEGRRA